MAEALESRFRVFEFRRPEALRLLYFARPLARHDRILSVVLSTRAEGLEHRLLEKPHRRARCTRACEALANGAYELEPQLHGLQGRRNRRAIFDSGCASGRLASWVADIEPRLHELPDRRRRSAGVGGAHSGCGPELEPRLHVMQHRRGRRAGFEEARAVANQAFRQIRLARRCRSRR